VIGVQNVGAGYVGGTQFNIRDGVSLKLGNGTVAATDAFSLLVTSEPDETGILSALGINSLFEGSEPGTFQVRSDLRQHPERLSSSGTGQPGDALNVSALAKLRDLRSPGLFGRTFVEELSDVTAMSGLVVQAADSQTTQLQAFQTRLETDRAAISGVDINQEMLQMMEVQRAYQAAARYLSTADQMLDDLFQLAR
jgi:flagellar hook-associated protein FlgK